MNTPGNVPMSTPHLVFYTQGCPRQLVRPVCLSHHLNTFDMTTFKGIKLGKQAARPGQLVRPICPADHLNTLDKTTLFTLTLSVKHHFWVYLCVALVMGGESIA